MTPVNYRRMSWLLGLFFVMALAIFTLWPEIDLWVSGLFHDPDEGFWLVKSPLIEKLRILVWNMSTAMVFLSVAGIAFGVAKWPIPGFGLREAAFIFLLYLLGPIILVNGILKNYWGRARPANITEFGGSYMFTPPYLPANQCQSNCSFVSGECSAAVALAIALFLLLPALKRVLPHWLIWCYATLALVLPLLTMALRVVTGRHFLSDTIFAVVTVFTVALPLHRLLLKRSGNQDGSC